MKIRYRLSLSTWEGIAPFAKHYYGRIRFDGKEIDLVKLGGSGRYSTKKLVMNAAWRWFKKNADGGSIATLGSYVVFDPQEVVFGPLTVSRKLNIIWREFDLLGWGGPRGTWPAQESLSAKWHKILNAALSESLL